MTLEEMEKRLTYLEDLQAIRDMHHEYLFQLNNKRWDDITDSFSLRRFLNQSRQQLAQIT